MSKTTAIKSDRIYTSEGIKKGFLIIREGKISSVSSELPTGFSGSLLDATHQAVLPGILDPHLHINEPGRTDWEGFETATQAAAAGGITTLIDMPLNSSPVTTDTIKLQMKIKASGNKLYVNCGFYGGVIPGNENELEDLCNSGVFGMKAFLVHSGIDEFPNTGPEELRKAMMILKEKGLPLLVHCELYEEHPGEKILSENPTSYQAYLGSHPKSWEDKAITMMIDLCRETIARLHIVHLSSADSLEQIKKAKAEGLPVTVETCPHYLFFSAEMIPDGQTVYKCAPPIREKANNDLLWKALGEGLIDFLGTDHSPAPPEIKMLEAGNFLTGWGGIAGLQFALPSVWNSASERGFTLNDLIKWFSTEPARFLGLEKQKGAISIGMDADLFIFDPETEFTPVTGDIYHRHKISPYIGHPLKGKVKATFVNGEMVFSEGKFYEKAGKVLLKN